MNGFIHQIRRDLSIAWASRLDVGVILLFFLIIGNSPPTIDDAKAINDVCKRKSVMRYLNLFIILYTYD